MVRLVDAPLEIEYDLCENEEVFMREFNALSQSDEDSVGQWLKLARARGETSESDQVLLTLLVELHRKLDDLSAYIKDEKKELLGLSKKAKIDSIGYENFHFLDEDIEEGKLYYGRILMPIFPKRLVPLFFVREGLKLTRITMIHEQDEKDWGVYLTARERVMIRQMRKEK